MIDLVSLLDLADLAVSRCEGVLASEERNDLASVARNARRRFGYVAEVLVVAFAGGTGSGKSSLINALVGDTLVQTGVARPTTDAATAVVPSGSANRFARLLSELDVEDRVESDALGDMIIIDLPDVDSTVRSHRQIVQRVLPVVDAVVWVLDPEKYSDRIIHKELLVELVPYERQFIFVLNKVDRLSDSAALVAADLGRLLVADGFKEPETISTIGYGRDMAVSALVDALSDRLDTKRTVISKILIDLRVVANNGWAETCSVESKDADQTQMDAFGLSAATFVLLGVAASSALSQLEES